MSHRRFINILASCALCACGCSNSSPISPSSSFRVTAITPSLGNSFGGDSALLSGEGFPPAVQVYLGGVAASSVVVKDSNTIGIVTPPHEAGTVDVEVVSGPERVLLRRSFTYERRDSFNAPPQLNSITGQGVRANEPPAYASVGERINLVASVTDDVTPLSNLTFQWSADRGIIEGSGDRVTFVAPSERGVASISLRIIERFKKPDDRGLPVDAENLVTGTTTVSVHEELMEIGDMAVDFLRLFSQSSVAPANVVHNFKDGCGAGGTGKRDELQQIIDNRMNYTILPDWSVGPARPQVSFKGVSPFRARRADGWAAVDVRWRSQCRVQNPGIGCDFVGQIGPPLLGTDWVTATYDVETRRWWLCDSDLD